MAGKSSKTEVITLRVPIALAAEWREGAAKGGVTVGSIIIGRVQAVPSLHQQMEMLKATIDAQAKKIARLERSGLKPSPIVDPHKPRPVVAGQLLGNPVLASVVPQVPGEVEWCGLKGGKGKKDKP